MVLESARKMERGLSGLQVSVNLQMSSDENKCNIREIIRGHLARRNFLKRFIYMLLKNYEINANKNNYLPSLLMSTKTNPDISSQIYFLIFIFFLELCVS